MDQEIITEAKSRESLLEQRVGEMNQTAAKIRRIQAQIEDHQEDVKLLKESLKDLQKKLLKQASDEIE